MVFFMFVGLAFVEKRETVKWNRASTLLIGLSRVSSVTSQKKCKKCKMCNLSKLAAIHCSLVVCVTNVVKYGQRSKLSDILKKKRVNSSSPHLTILFTLIVLSFLSIYLQDNFGVQNVANCSNSAIFIFIVRIKINTVVESRKNGR